MGKTSKSMYIEWKIYQQTEGLYHQQPACLPPASVVIWSNDLFPITMRKAPLRKCENAAAPSPFLSAPSPPCTNSPISLHPVWACVCVCLREWSGVGACLLSCKPPLAHLKHCTKTPAQHRSTPRYGSANAPRSANAQACSDGHTCLSLTLMLSACCGHI